MRTVRATIAVTAVLLLTAGCASLSGRQMGQWVDDRETTARVKTALGAAKLPPAGRVDVDTSGGTVYLTGLVDSEETKRRAEDIARSVSGVRQVVNGLAVRAAGPTPPREEGSVESGPRVPAATPPPPPSAPEPPSMIGPITRLERLDGQTGAPGDGPWAAYDREGRMVATVYAVPAPETSARGTTVLPTGDRPIRSISVLPHPALQGRQYLLVLWHVPPGEGAQLR